MSYILNDVRRSEERNQVQIYMLINKNTYP